MVVVTAIVGAPIILMVVIMILILIRILRLAEIRTMVCRAEAVFVFG